MKHSQVVGPLVEFGEVGACGGGFCNRNGDRTLNRLRERTKDRVWDSSVVKESSPMLDRRDDGSPHIEAVSTMDFQHFKLTFGHVGGQACEQCPPQQGLVPRCRSHTSHKQPRSVHGIKGGTGGG